MFSRRGRVVAVLLTFAVLSGVSAAQKAAPEVIILHGGILETPNFITDKRETHAFSAAVSEAVPVSTDELAGRLHFDAALFWGLQWARYARDSVKVRTLRPEEADQQARIYLPRRMAEAPVFVFRRGTPDARTARRVSPEGMRLLQLHQVPLHEE